MGKTDDDAIAKLTSYLPRYVGVAERAGLSDEFARHRDVEIVERVMGSGSADYWGIATSRRRSSGKCWCQPSWCDGSTSSERAGATSTRPRSGSQPSFALGRAAAAGPATR